MKSAIRVAASAFGITAGLASIEHGYFEMLQGNIAPDSIMIASMGSPCDPDMVWNACEPAMTIIPSFLITGVLAIIVGIIVAVWAGAFVQKKNGGLVLILLSILMLLVGGGIFPPLIGIIGGVVGTRINASLTWWRARRSGSLSRFLIPLYPWPLVLFLLWTFVGQWLLGYFFGEFMLRYAAISPILVIALLLLAVFSGFARDSQSQTE